MFHLQKHLEKPIRKLLPYSWIVFIFFILLTYLAFPHAIKLLTTISTDLSKLLPDHYPSVKIGNEVKKKFKKEGGGDLIIVIDSSNPEQNKRAILDIAAYLEKMPEVERVKFKKKGYSFFDEHKLLYIEKDDLYKIRSRVKQKIQHEKLGGLYIDFENEGEGKKGDPFNFDDLIEKYRKQYTAGIKTPYYSNKSETIFSLWVFPSSKDKSLGYFKKFFKLIESKMEAFPLQNYGPDMSIGYAGSIKTRLDEYKSLIDDLKKAGLISLIGIFLLLIVTLRRPVGIILLFIPLSCGIILSFAFCSFFIDSLNVVTSFLFSILFGLGVDIGIHLFARYLEDRQEGLSQADAMMNILFKTGRSSSIAAFTTCATFFILIINDFRGFSEFGLIAGCGLLTILFTYLIFFPPILYLAEKVHLLRIKKSRKNFLNRLLKKWPVFPQANKVVVGSIIVLALSLMIGPLVQFEWNYGVLKFQVPETQQAREKFKLTRPRVNSPAAIIIHNENEAEGLKKRFAELKSKDEEKPTIDYFRSYYDLFPKDQEEKMRVLKDIDKLLADDALNVLKGDDKELVDEFRSSIAKTSYVEAQEVPEEVKKAFFGRPPYEKEQVAFIYPLAHLELGDGRNAVSFYEDVHEVEAGGKKFYAVSDSIVFAEVLNTMFKDSKRAIFLALGVLLFLIYIDFRDFKKTALILGTLVTGVVWMCAVVVIFGMKFNFYNMITIPVVLGMGVDNSVHLVHRFDEFKGTSVMKALFTSGAAASLASLTTMLGYSGLMFAHHPGLNSIGSFAVIGMITCMLSSLVFLPAILQITIHRRRKRS